MENYSTHYMMHLVKNIMKTFLKRILRIFGLELIRIWSPHRQNAFFSRYYQRNTRRRLEHLASLPLSFAGSSVFEVGAGIGDHTDFFIDRGSQIVTSDARPECLRALRARFPGTKVIEFDLERPSGNSLGSFDFVYCAGVLYHVKDPEEAIGVLAKLTRQVLIISTIVSYEHDSSITLITEDPQFELHSVSGKASRPSRLWVFDQLKGHFPFVYMPTTQPYHAEFPIDWTCRGEEPLPKAVFIASREAITSPLLIDCVPMKQTH